MKNDEYYHLDINDNLRMKIFMIQGMLEDDQILLTATEVLESCVDYFFERCIKRLR